MRPAPITPKRITFRADIWVIPAPPAAPPVGERRKEKNSAGIVTTNFNEKSILLLLAQIMKIRTLFCHI
jgi:hypothetical protein